MPAATRPATAKIIATLTLPDDETIRVLAVTVSDEGERVRPCGRCEKCRRVVGMLRALAADPANCGYSQEQIDHCLHALATAPVHQEEAGARQLAWMLVARGLIPDEPGPRFPAREHPEVLESRVSFDARAGTHYRVSRHS